MNAKTNSNILRIASFWIGLIVFMTIAFLDPDAFLPAVVLAGIFFFGAQVYVARPPLRGLLLLALVLIPVTVAIARLVGPEIHAFIVLFSGIWLLGRLIRVALAKLFGHAGETARVLMVRPHGSKVEVPEKLPVLARPLIAFIRRGHRQAAVKFRNPPILDSTPSIPASASSAVAELTDMNFRLIGRVGSNKKRQLLLFHRDSDGLVADILIGGRDLPFNMSVCSYLSHEGGEFSTALASAFSRESDLVQVFPDATPTELVDRHVATVEMLKALGVRFDVLAERHTILDRYFFVASETTHQLAELPDKELLGALLRLKERDYPNTGPLFDDRDRLERAIAIARSQVLAGATSPHPQPS